VLLIFGCGYAALGISCLPSPNDDVTAKIGAKRLAVPRTVSEFCSEIRYNGPNEKAFRNIGYGLRNPGLCVNLQLG
jgi:hypothetical protein